RLPGKVMKPILERPMLELQLERLSRASLIDELVVATGTQPEDGVIADLCESLNIPCFSGSNDDVLDRCYRAVSDYSPRLVMRLTGDCPLVDPKIIDGLVHFFRDGNFDYASNTLKPTWPDGLDAELMRFETLESAWSEATLRSEREHVTPFIYKNNSRFHLGSYENDVDLSSHRWTVDEQADFDLVTAVYESLYPQCPNFSTQDVLNFVQSNKYLLDKNSVYERNEGYKKALLKDHTINKK
ncbi:MAG: glycosyltransferase family protein, partial [Burkholderiales bacterium]|nr:glycosyltransferase family protein [Burkholderiales bacterium]